MHSLLISEPTPVALQGRPENIINGSDSESYAMAKIVLACRGEGSWGSREEDNSKIDLMFSCEHPWLRGERMLILAQVKSGPSYGVGLVNGFKLTGAAKKAAKRTSHGICVVWVDRAENRIFWAYVHPNTTIRPQEYGPHHEVSPAMPFDLARCMTLARSGAIGGKGIIVRVRSSALTKRRKNVRKTYRELGPISSPVLGQIRLTRLGWRHMFRKGRSKQNKSTSLSLIPYLKKILEQWPSVHVITDIKTFESKGYKHRVCEHLLKYEEISINPDQTMSSGRAVAHIRIVEEIRYPADWESNVMLSQLVSRRLALRSAYFKSS